MRIDRNTILKVCKLAWIAGKEIIKIYSKEFKIFKKKDMSPVTLADLESEKIIIKGLNKILMLYNLHHFANYFYIFCKVF